MGNLGRDSLCDELAGDIAAGESMPTWLWSTDCFREILGGLDGGGVVDFRWPLACRGLNILPEKTKIATTKKTCIKNINPLLKKSCLASCGQWVCNKCPEELHQSLSVTCSISRPSALMQLLPLLHLSAITGCQNDSQKLLCKCSSCRRGCSFCIYSVYYIQYKGWALICKLGQVKQPDK